MREIVNTDAFHIAVAKRGHAILAEVKNDSGELSCACGEWALSFTGSVVTVHDEPFAEWVDHATEVTEEGSRTRVINPPQNIDARLDGRIGGDADDWVRAASDYGRRMALIDSIVDAALVTDPPVT